MTADDLSDAGRLWATAQALDRAAAAVSPAGRRLPPLLFFTDPARTPEPWAVAERLPAGAGMVYRGFGAGDAGATAARLRDIARRRGLVLLIGADEGLAAAVEADGLHLPERMADEAASVRRRRPGWLITAAIHSPEGPGDAGGLDALIAAPVFATRSAAGRPPLGVEGLESIVERFGRPTYALGGIDADTAERLSGAGVCGLAAVEAIRIAFGP